jgi:MoaA/NifB/PqqE/SkfB family radical SAM enzyme
MTFCHSPWTNLDISPTGDIAPCCKFQTGLYDQHFNIQQHNLDDYVGSAFLTTIKQEFQAGQWPQGCKRCRIEEENNIQSKRQLDLERWSLHYDNYDIDRDKWITASIAFGNTCNLKCITCNSETSSRWQKEYHDIYGVNNKHVKFYKQDFVEKFVKQAPNVVHLDIPGGEPFLSGVAEQQQLLRHYIDTGQASKITLHYTTNATVFPDHVWWDLWQHFREVDLQLSIDGIGDKYEYIRYPATWIEVAQNVHRYIVHQSGNTRLSVSHTVSAYNIYYLDEFFSWCYTVGLPRPWCGRVHNPVHMRPSVWPEHVRTAIADHLTTSEHTDVRNWARLILNSDDSSNFSTFATKTQEHDKYRGLDFASTFKEMAVFLNET